ncbi:hypothetical protein CNMCM8980_010076 [Aspergillus fumigatiaffinis]|uniref:Uncharacterized protein n=1 Tax=Aspergillus fumigatiaffinis TaxID=340414 RepID=A0A8H4HEJ2_9EURO|nr:hypothetical protein CNMCM5878_000708 [Aspergillus fumigatiaffinis]KAF4217979.1 hypothetical protein CNMCM6457_004132 [Aspergillus fumigatiaffinis]KAF4242916.1 hypothetical protein CNMCM6805_002024 [Aspergillus fumigatiaffinis]KAF4250754.1 hypothetical protein CNMCM8980_010076 [Aspergillus fumigatiaffinis]
MASVKQVIIQKGGCFQMEAPRASHPRALRQKDKKAIKKKKKAKMDSSIKTLRAEVDRLEKAAAAEEAEVVRKRSKAKELLRAIKEKEEEEEKEKKDKEGKAKTCALVVRAKENEMEME